MEDGLRIDKWLWHARFYRSRALAQAKAAAGHIRLNGRRIEKPGTRVHIGDVVTLAALGTVIAARVLDFGRGRGTASQARALYQILPADKPRA